jgi:uncharacterized protein (TIGR01244 family)
MTKDNFKQVSNDFSVSGQVTPEELKQAAEEGFKSVLNLRSANEKDVLTDEYQHAVTVGLDYANVALQPTSADEDLVNQALAEIDKLPKPVLLHCGGGLRAGAIALIATAIKEDFTLEQLITKAEEIELSLEQPHLKQFIEKTYKQD